jgi:hypothetical protein
MRELFDRRGSITVAKPKAKTLQERMGFVDADLKAPGHDAVMLWLDDQATPEQLAVWIGRSDWSRDERDKTAKMDEYVEQYKRYHQSELANAQQRVAERQKHVEYVMKRHAEEPSVWTERNIESARRDLEDAKNALLLSERMASEATEMRAPPIPAWPGLKIIRKQWEMPVLSGTYTVGFVDLALHYTYPVLNADNGQVYENYSVRQKTLPSWKISWMEQQLYFEVKTTIPSLGELLRQLSVYRTYLTTGGKWDRHEPSIAVVSPDIRYADKIKE